MKDPVLVIMAAGMGSRYGGLKQIDPVDDFGHIIIDYSIFDAMRAGFRDFVFIIKHAIEADFREVMDKHLAGKDINVTYVFQEIDKLPEGFSVPEGRVKPWGTAHAISCCYGELDAPFAVINADDYYGPAAFFEIYNFLKSAEDGERYDFAMVGYEVGNTVTESGTVSRGVCTVSDGGRLTDIVERTKVGTDGGQIYYIEEDEKYPLASDTPVSMNLWGFTPSYISECRTRFAKFLEKSIPENPMKCEFYLPTVVSELIAEGRAEVKVLRTPDKWYGVTYKEDKPSVVAAFRTLTESGVYPKEF